MIYERNATCQWGRGNWLSNTVIAGPDPAIGYPHQFANDAIPASNHLDGDGLVGPGLALRAVRQHLIPMLGNSDSYPLSRHGWA